MWAKLFHFDRCFGDNFGDIHGNDPGDRQARQEEVKLNAKCGFVCMCLYVCARARARLFVFSLLQLPTRCFETY